MDGRARAKLTSCGARIVTIDACEITSERPRTVGCNSFRGSHGRTISEPIVRLHTDAGVVGWGRCSATPAEARLPAGRRVDEIFSLEQGGLAGYDLFDTALWDLAGRLEGKAVHALLGSQGEQPVPIYDGSIYMEDIDPETGRDRGLSPVEEAVRMGLDGGFAAFKAKIGRGSRWMERAAGFRRDIDVIHRVRELLGSDRKLLLDANNAYSPEEARELVRQVRQCGIFWFEEPFQEDIDASLAFKRFLHEDERPILLADGEGTRPSKPGIRAMLRAGALDVVQFDLRPVPIGSWLPILPLIQEKGILAAPHNWHSHLLNYYVPHFGRGIRGFCMAETDISETDDVDASRYRMSHGSLQIPDAPGFGLELDHGAIDRRVRKKGWSVTTCE